jgi:putative transcriptional regulator
MKSKLKNSELFQNLKQGLTEAISYTQGKTKARIHRRKVNVAPLPRYKPDEIKKIRERLNLSQRTFAEVIGVSIKSIEAWEAGRSEANGSAQRILSIIDNDEKSLEKYDLVEIS